MSQSTREPKRMVPDSEQGADFLRSLLNADTTRRQFMGRSIAAAVVPSLMAGVLSACATGGQSTAKTKTLLVAMSQGSLRTLDPDSAYEPEWPIFGRALYDQLVTYRAANISDLVADYAKTWDVSQDGLSYVFNLDPAVKFSDGTAATADDLVWSFQRFLNLKGPGSYLLDGVKSVEKTGPNQVKLSLDGINVGLLSILTTPSLNLAQTSAMKAHGGTNAADAAKTDTAGPWLDQHSAGSGPFVLDSWTRGTKLVLKRNPNYWGPAPKVDQIIFNFVADPGTQRDVLLRGDAHVALNLTPDIAASLAQGHPDISIVKIGAVAPVFLGWSAQLNPALRNTANWDAIKFAIDYDGLRSIYQGGGDYIGSCTPPELAGGLPRGEHQAQDLDKAKAALAQAGNPNGFSFTLTFGTDEVFGTVHSPDVATKIKSDLARVGITANLDPKLFSEAQTANRAGKLEAYLHWWSLDFASWTDSLPYFAAGGSVARKRFQWDSSASAEAKQISDLATTALTTLDQTKQLQMVQQAQRMLNQHGPYSWLFEAFYQFGVRKDIVSRFDANPIWFFEPSTVELA
ncbi:ABC transporter substrate-binding protein [bacterium]|nr:MAG: ABC transporter substrate-binding protein [bacterium]